MLCWREFLGILILFHFGWISSAPTLCHLPDSYNKGHCVPVKNCTAIDLSGSLISPDVFEDLTKRHESCSAFGKHLVCCEITKYEPQFEPVTMVSSTSTSKSPVTTESIITTTAAPQSTTEALADPVEIVVKSPEPEEIVDYENFKLLDLKKCGDAKANRVANGEDAGLLDNPWAVRLKYERGHKMTYNCGGSLISEYYVLTAAHCFDPRAGKLISVRLGEYNETSDKDCDFNELCADPVQDIDIESSVVHPNYNNPNLANDIALIRLSKPANLTQNNINTICLPFDKKSSKMLTKDYIVVGWGATQNSSAYPVLQKANLPPVTISDCQSKLSKPFALQKIQLTENQLCAGGVGDSGGPLYSPALVNKKPRIVQYGIVSFGINSCGMKSLPGVYTNVAKYVGWILDNMS